MRDRTDHQRPRALATASLLALLGASGCALTNMKLEPPPHARVSSATPVGQGRDLLVVQPFADRRPNQTRCGMKKNGYNMDTANIECATPPNQFLAGLLADELRAAGFRVATDPAQAAPGALRIEGVLSQFFLEPDVGGFTFTPEADIELQLRATSQSGLQAERRFYVKGTEVSLAGTEDNFRLAADAAIKQMLNRAVAAVVELIRQYPELGAPARVAMAGDRLGSWEVRR